MCKGRPGRVRLLPLLRCKPGASGTKPRGAQGRHCSLLRHHRIDRAGILPRPKRQIPIWLGGFSEAAFDRAARIGDGFLFSGRTQTEAVQIKARIEAKLVELGRNKDSFGFESIQQYSRGDNQWPGDITAWRAAGGSHISVVTMGANLTTVDGHIEAIKQWRDVYNSV